MPVHSRWCYSFKIYCMTKPLYTPFIHSFIDHFYSASSSPLLLRSAPDTARMLCRSFTPKRPRQLWVKDLPKVPTWRLERELSPQPSGWKLSTQPMRHHVPILHDHRRLRQIRVGLFERQRSRIDGDQMKGKLYRTRGSWWERRESHTNWGEITAWGVATNHPWNCHGGSTQVWLIDSTAAEALQTTWPRIGVTSHDQVKGRVDNWVHSQIWAFLGSFTSSVLSST